MPFDPESEDPLPPALLEFDGPGLKVACGEMHNFSRKATVSVLKPTRPSFALHVQPSVQLHLGAAYSKLRARHKLSRKVKMMCSVARMPKVGVLAETPLNEVQ